MIHRDCSIPVMFGELKPGSSNTMEFFYSYIVPGLFIGCSILDSLFYSTLECFYSNNECFSIVTNYTYSQKDAWKSYTKISPLVYDSASSRFPPNTLLSKIIKEIMIDQWNSFFSFNQYYNACAPIQCTYPEKIRTKTFGQVMITLLSSITGLIAAVRLIVPLLIEFILGLFKPKVKQERSNIV